MHQFKLRAFASRLEKHFSSNLKKSASVRRQVENAAFNLLEEFPKDQKSQDDYYNTYPKDYSFELTDEDLFFATVDLLEEKGWDIEDESLPPMIETNIEVFLESDDYQKMRVKAMENSKQDEQTDRCEWATEKSRQLQSMSK